MGIKLFHKTQRDLASSINHVIDRYWDNEIEEDQMMGLVKTLYNNNDTKFLKNGDFTTVLKQQCGKRRLEVVNKILSNRDKCDGKRM
ncbi:MULTISPECIES: TIGR04540 family protein [Pontibacillus]|uniref:TIGR04540 family protein n=1 Tax=Pontibacillus chungwhensis TaxID=265426 RepID=A0ABY8UZ75_9BACI|nr:TIGR04540 family protein [Pontibacillus chungwhensis]MCD5325370.1 TIGR04540 family protein [Pontibacillus sp. HN14]WIF98488.1 TIGR04540 family protein [Pontibacillus chungwhensis]